MDDFAKRYALILATLVVLGLAWWLFSRDSIAGDVNAALARDPGLAGYPYTFRVVSVDDGVATVMSPRSAGVPVIRFLRTAFPELADMPVNHPDAMAAQDGLVSMQARAAEIITAAAEVRSIEWQLDEQWYVSRGVYLDIAR